MTGKYLVSNIGAKIHLCCGNSHTEREEMTIESGPHGVFFSCPKYRQENRSAGEPPCFNRLSVAEYEKMLTRLSQEYIQADETGTKVLSLQGLTWTDRHITYTVVEDTSHSLWVQVLNVPALKNIRR